MNFFLEKISKNLTVAIPASMLAGFFYGLYFSPEPLKKLVLPLTFLMVYPMMVNLNWKKLFSKGDFKPVLVAQVLNFLVVPAMTLVIALVFFKNHPYMLLGLFLSSLFPTSGMTITWTGFSRGNVEAAVKMTLIGLTAGTVLAPVYLKFALGRIIPLNIEEVFRQIVLIIILPLILGFLTQYLLVRIYGQQQFQNSISKKFPPYSTLGVLGIVFVAIALKAESIASSPTHLLVAIVPVVIVYFLNVTIATMISRQMFAYEDGVAIVFGTAARNLSIALALAVNAFGARGSDAALVLAAAFIIQAQVMAWYSKLTDKFLTVRIKSSPVREKEGVNVQA